MNKPFQPLVALSAGFAIGLAVVSAANAAPRLDARTRAAATVVRLSLSRSAERSALQPADQTGALDVFIRGNASRAALEAAGATVRTTLPGLCTASVPIEALDRVAAVAGVTAVRLAAAVEPELSASVPTTGVPLLRGTGPAFAGLNGRGVLVGSVDTGVDFDHGDFRDSTGMTRFISIWDQVARGAGNASYPYGRMWSAAEINAGLCTEADSSGHGTHVLGIAAGDGSQTGGATPRFTHAGMAPAADLALVKSNFSTAAVLDGVRWLFDLAASRGEAAVVNLSIGTQFGPHDGSSDFEQGLESLVGPGRILVKSAGNDRGTAKHAEASATAMGTSITLSVSGSALNRAFAIDGYYDATERMRVKLTTPSGVVIGPLSLGSECAVYPGVSTTSGTVYVAQESLATGRRNLYVEVNAASASHNMNGTWTITFLADQLGPANGRVDLWRFYASGGLTANFIAGNQPTRELISEPGNAPNVITVGSYVTRTVWTACNGTVSNFSSTPAAGGLSTFSSPGPTRDGRQKPDLVAPGEAILSATSFDIPVTCPGSGAASTYGEDAGQHTAMRGTSMSAPHVAGAVALLLEKRGALTPAEVKAYLTLHARRDAATGTAATNDWGAGKLNLGDLLDPVVDQLSVSPQADVLVDGALSLHWNGRDSLGSVASVDLELSRTGLDGAYESIAAGIPNTGSYSWAVTGPSTGAGQAFVRVIAHDTNGNTGSAVLGTGFTIHSPLAVGAHPALEFSLGAITPNPASGPLRVAFTLAHQASVRVVVHDPLGRHVVTLASGAFGAGEHEAVWNLTRQGVPVRGGLYFVSYDTPDGRLTHRVVVSR